MMKSRINEQTGHVLSLLYILLVFSLITYTSKLSLIHGHSNRITGEQAVNSFHLISGITWIVFALLKLLTQAFLVFYFLRWSYLTYKFLRGREELYYLTHSPGTAVISWFIPVLNLFMPFLVMRDIYESLHELADSGRNSHNSRLVSLWWGLFILSAIFTLFGNSASIASQIAGTDIPPGAFWKEILVIALKLLTVFTTVMLFRRMKKLTQWLSAM